MCGSLAREGRTKERWRKPWPGVELALRLEVRFRGARERNSAVIVMDDEYLFFSPRKEERGYACEENVFTESVAMGGWNSGPVDELSGVEVRLGGKVNGRRRLRISSAVSLTSSATLFCLGPSEEMCKEIVARSAGTVMVEEPLSCTESLWGVRNEGRVTSRTKNARVENKRECSFRNITIYRGRIFLRG